MSTKPCFSNDALDLANESEDSSWGIQATRGNSDPKGSGCDDNNVFTTSAVMPVVTEALTEPEDVVEEVEEELDVEELELELEEEEEDEEADVEDVEDVNYISCNSESAEDPSRLDLKYDYEMTRTTEDVDLALSVKGFEIDLLKHMAEKFGLSKCDTGRRSLRNGRKLASSTIVGVGSYPDDLEDPMHTECEVDLGSPCTPINGLMTAWVDTSSGRRLSESDLYESIEDYSKTYTSDRVLAISYIGNRPDDLVQANVPFIDKATKDDGNTGNLVASSSSSMAPGAIAGIAVGSALTMLALLALLFVAKKRRDRNRRNEEQEVSRSIVNDALFMDDEVLKEVDDDASKSSVETEDHTFAETLPSSPTFESEGGREPEESGFEVQI